MPTVNKHIIIGNVGKKPVLRTTTSGMNVVNFSIATQDGPKGQDGKPAPNWHKCVAFDKKADFVAQYIDQGTTVYVEGPCSLKSYKDKNGVDRYDKETTVYQIETLSRTQRDSSPPQQPYAPQYPAYGYAQNAHISNSMPPIPPPQPEYPGAQDGYGQPAHAQAYSQPSQAPQAARATQGPPPGHPAAKAVPQHAQSANQPAPAPPPATYGGEDDLPF